MPVNRKPASSPPPYSQDGKASPTPKQYPLPLNVKPSNFIEISTVDTVKGVFVVDPELTPPASLMSPLQDQEDRKNVFIQSQDGVVNVDLFVVPSPDIANNRKITMKLNSWSASAQVRVHDAEPPVALYSRRPIDIFVKASMKKADVYIPRSFRGPLHLITTKMGKVWYSPDVRAQVTPISSINGVHKCFVGEYRLTDWKDGGKSWPGDALQVDSKDAINIYYDDEGSIPVKDTNDEGCVVA